MSVLALIRISRKPAINVLCVALIGLTIYWVCDEIYGKLGVPRNAVLHDYLPGIAIPLEEDVERCDGKYAISSTEKCQRIFEAFSGDAHSALLLANAYRGSGLKSQMIYWYTVASEDGDAEAMLSLGKLLRDEPFLGDVNGSRLRGRFWIEMSALQGNQDAKKLLNVIDGHENFQQSSLDIKSPGQNEKQVQSAGESVMLSCTKHLLGWSFLEIFEHILGGHPKAARIQCQDIHDLERKALGGDELTAETLVGFLDHHGGTREDHIYWHTIAAENGSRFGMSVVAGHFWYETPTHVRKARASFWWRKAAKLGDEDSEFMLKEFGSP